MEFRRDVHGNLFVIRNERVEFKDDTMIFKADIAGNTDAAAEYLRLKAKNIQLSFDVKKHE